MDAIKFSSQRQETLETVANVRQQDKIIKVLESGDSSAINQPSVVVFDSEREQFRQKVTRGEIGAASIDNSVIKNIAAPFSGRDGVQMLHEQLKNTPRQQKSAGEVIWSSLYGQNAMRREDWQPSVEELGQFVQMYPTPRAFDAAFVGNRLQDLQAEFEREQSPTRRDALKIELSLQRQKEKDIYPRLRAALYGKRNEYWEQAKLLLRSSGKNSVDVIDDTPESQKERPDSSEVLPSRDQLIVSDLAYQDAPLADEVKRGVLEYQQAQESTKKYADSLLQLSQKETLENIRSLARELLATMLREATRIKNMPVTTYGQSMTWAMWDIGKQYYFFTHPDEVEPGYEDVGNPLESQAKQNEIINRHLGWEAYAAFRSNAEWRQKVMDDTTFAPALELLSKPPKENNTLSSKDLADLGKVLREVR